MDVVAGPQQTPPRVSLISSAEVVTVSENDTYWISGFVADLDGQGGASTFPVCPPEDEQFNVTATGGNAAFKPYVLYATDKASTYGTTNKEDRDFYDRAQRKLQAGESTALERILWSGYAGELNANPFLADGTGAYDSDGLCADVASQTITITSDVTKAADALAMLEQAIGENTATRGMIHMRPVAFHALASTHVVRREGNVWLSPMDNIVVPGRGYPGTGPAGEPVGATEWMYGHAGIVQIRRAGIDRLGEADLASQVNRYTNDRAVIVQRVAHVLLDPTSQVYAIDFDSLGNYSSIPSTAFTALAVTASNTADVNTDALIGWSLTNGGVAADTITITLATDGPDEVITINLAAGESVTYMLPSAASVTNIAYTSGVGITGQIFVAA